MYKICIDTGGTFTESVVLDADGKLYEFKTPTTPWDFSEGVMNTTRDAAAYFKQPLDNFLHHVDWIVHGTTVSTNALVQRNLSRTALITTRGFRDIIEMRRSQKIETKSMYDAFIPPYQPVIPRHLRFTVSEKTSKCGVVESAIDEQELLEVVRKLEQEKIEAVAICFINSYLNPENERRAAEICRRELPGVFVTYSSDIIPKMGEYERASTCVISASVGPIVEKYLSKLEDSLREAGFSNQLLIVQANQFVQSVSSIVKKPVYLTGSGPAAGPAGAIYLGQAIHEDNFIIGDMGGTTWDASIIKNAQVPVKIGDWLGDDRIGIKVADVISVGAGGGSIGWIDPLGLLRVGPKSASSDPGPACYNRGGTEPTVTDAAMVMGYINPDNFCGGKLTLKKELAVRSMQPIADALGMSPVEAAQALFSTVNTNMADAISEISTRKGYDVRDFALLSTGGGGPLCSIFVADVLGMKKTIIPRFSSSFCAWSMFFLDIGNDYLRSYLTTLNEADIDIVNDYFQDMTAEALKGLKAFDVSRTDLNLEKTVELRYRDQYHMLEIPIRDEKITGKTLRAVAEEFHQMHKDLFTFSLPWVPIETTNLRLTVKIKSSKLPITQITVGGKDPSGAFIEERSCYFDSGYVATPIYDGVKLEAGNIIDGSAIIQEPTTTVVVPAGFECLVDPYGNYVVSKVDCI